MFQTSLNDLPPMPIVAGKVLELMQEADITAEELAQTISHDPAISAQILKMANSSFYSLRQQVKSLDHAIVVLGEKTMRSLVLAASLKGVNRSWGLMEKMLWEDSIGCAIGARLTARAFHAADPEEAFLGGLFRHFGKMVMNSWDAGKYSRVVEAVYSGEGTPEEMEHLFFQTSHAEVGAQVLEKWEFADSLIHVVRHHENFSLEGQREDQCLAAVVNVAEYLCRRTGIGRRAPEEDLNLMIAPGARFLGCDPERLEQLSEEFRTLYEFDRDYFFN